MGGPRINKKYPHPTDDAFPDLYRISCCKSLVFSTPLGFLCKECWLIRAQPPILGYGHVLVDGFFSRVLCKLCKRNTTKTRPIVECNECLTSYHLCLEYLQTLDFTREKITHLMYDVRTQEVVYVKLR